MIAILVVIGTLLLTEFGPGIYNSLFKEPTPVEDYARSLHLPNSTIKELKPLDNDHYMSQNEQQLVDQLAVLHDGGYLNASLIQHTLNTILSDGKVIGSEVLTISDPDHDYVSNSIEMAHHTDPTNAYTSGTNLDDYNALFTYGIDPNNHKAVEDFLHEIPHVVARHWNPNDGGVGGYTTEKYATISERDPLVQWYAKHSDIKWEPGTGAFTGEKIGMLNINGGDASNGLKGPNDLTSTVDQPSYFLTHGRKGGCVESSLTNLVILRLMDGGNYKAIQVGNNDHAWCEALIDGNVYVVDYNIVTPRDVAYKFSNYNPITINDNSENGYSSYDPDWYLK